MNNRDGPMEFKDKENHLSVIMWAGNKKKVKDKVKSVSHKIGVRGRGDV